jgi:acetyltransferase-like isoleucine patch superfamily enzyme
MKFSRLKKALKAAYLRRRYRLEAVGNDFEIGKYCVIRRNEGARIILGRGFCTRNFVTLNVRGVLEIGDNVFINAYTSINVRDTVSIGSETLIGEGVRIYDHDHLFRTANTPVAASGFKLGAVRIGRNVWLGSNAVILRGITIGDGAVVAAGAVVSRDVPADHLYFSRDRIEPITRSAIPPAG